MQNLRQNKVSELIKRELSLIFQREARTICQGAMVSVTTVRITPDLSYAKVYLSIFGSPKKDEIIQNIKKSAPHIKYLLGKSISNQARKVPDLNFFLDDSLDYAETIDTLLKK